MPLKTTGNMLPNLETRHVPVDNALKRELVSIKAAASLTKTPSKLKY